MGLASTYIGHQLWRRMCELALHCQCCVQYYIKHATLQTLNRSEEKQLRGLKGVGQSVHVRVVYSMLYTYLRTEVRSERTKVLLSTQTRMRFFTRVKLLIGYCD